MEKPKSLCRASWERTVGGKGTEMIIVNTKRQSSSPQRNRGSSVSVLLRDLDAFDGEHVKWHVSRQASF